MKVLLLAYFYPPYVAAGATRAGHLARAWRRLGAQVTVLAATPTDVPRFGRLDEAGVVWTRPFEVNAIPRLALRRDVTSFGYGSRGLALDLLGNIYRQLINFPDGQVGWLPAAIRRGLELCGEQRPDVLVSTSPPATAHLVALYLSRRTRIPWVAEFRDPWTDNPNFSRWGPLGRMERSLERRVLHGAQLVVGVTPSLAKRLSELGAPVEYVPNGFDPEDYQAGGVDPNLLLHVGTVYPSYDLKALLAALRMSDRPPRVRFVGRNLAPIRDALRDWPTSGVELCSPVGRSEALRGMSTAWANLAFIYRSGPAQAQQEYAQQKLYEYIGAGRPIIVVGPRAGDGADLLARSGLARFASGAQQLRQLFDERAWVDGVRVNAGVVSEYSYRTIASKYLTLLNRVARPTA